MSQTILIVDQDKGTSELQKLLRAESFRVTVESTGEGVLGVLDKQPPDAIVLDTEKLGLAGFRIAGEIRAHTEGARLPLILLAGIYRGAAHKAEAVRRYDLVAYLDKPVDATQLIGMLRHALRGAPAATASEKLVSSKIVLPPPLPSSDILEGPSQFTQGLGTKRGLTRSRKLPTSDATPDATTADTTRPDFDALVDGAQKREKREVERTVKQLAEAEGALLRGNLHRLAFPRLLHRLYLKQAQGALFLLRGKAKKIVYFEDGHPIFIRSNRLSECLGQLLVRERFINQHECEESVRRMKDEKRQQGAILIGMRLMSPHNLKYSLERQLEVKLWDVFSWSDGEYRFRKEVRGPDQVVTLEPSNVSLIWEGIRQTYSPERLEDALIGMLDSYLQPSTTPFVRFQPLVLDEDERAAVTLADGTRTLAQWLEQAPLSPQRACAFAYALLCAGMLEPVATASPSPLPTLFQTDGHATLPLRLRPDMTGQQLAAYALELRNQDHFAALGLRPAAAAADIQQAYFRLAPPYHPDHYRSKPRDMRNIASEIFDRLAQAHATLTDPERRGHYEAELGRGGHGANDSAACTLAAERHFASGEEHLREQRFGQAAGEFSRAVDLCPENALYRAELGWSLYKEKPNQRDKALSELKRAAKLEPKQERVYLFLGYIYQEMGRSKQAEFEFEKALQCNPSCKPALRELRRLYGER